MWFVRVLVSKVWLKESFWLPLPVTPAATCMADMAPAASYALYCPIAFAASNAICACCTALLILAVYWLICISE